MGPHLSEGDCESLEDWNYQERITNRREKNMDITRNCRFSEKLIFCIIRLLGGFGMVRNTPTGCGNNLPILLRSDIFAKIDEFSGSQIPENVENLPEQKIVYTSRF